MTMAMMEMCPQMLVECDIFNPLFLRAAAWLVNRNPLPRKRVLLHRNWVEWMPARRGAGKTQSAEALRLDRLKIRDWDFVSLLNNGGISEG
jgi:hypothetical protein